MGGLHPRSKLRIARHDSAFGTSKLPVRITRPACQFRDWAKYPHRYGCFKSTIRDAATLTATQAVEVTTRVLDLRPLSEWRFQVAPGADISVRILSGTAEKDGIELVLRNAYKFSATKSRITTFHGCEIEVEGATEQSSVVDFPNPNANPFTSYLSMHAELENQRAQAARNRTEGPRVLVTGPQSSGKTTLARSLTSYATKQGGQPIAVNMNPAEGMLSLPGTLSAGVFATVMDPEAADGWGGTPTSGPSSVPVKLPLVYNFGRENAEDDADFYKELTSKLASAVSGRLSEDPSVKSSGVIVDGPSIDETSQLGMDLISHIVDEFTSKNILIVGEGISITNMVDSKHHSGD